MGRLKRLPERLSALPDRVARVVEPDRTQRPAYHAWYKTAEWQKLRWKVLVRDRFTCRLCGVVEGRKGQQIADHIQPHRGDAALFWDENNLQCLCKTCHDSTKQREDKARW